MIAVVLTAPSTSAEVGREGRTPPVGEGSQASGCQLQEDEEAEEDMSARDVADSCPVERHSVSLRPEQPRWIASSGTSMWIEDVRLSLKIDMAMECKWCGKERRKRIHDRAAGKHVNGREPP